jgi:hypothetical protein
MGEPAAALHAASTRIGRTEIARSRLAAWIIWVIAGPVFLPSTQNAIDTGAIAMTQSVAELKRCRMPTELGAKVVAQSRVD